MGNYREGTDRPLQILDLFFKSPEGISGPGDTVVLPPHQANIFHHEGRDRGGDRPRGEGPDAPTRRWTRSSATSPSTMSRPAASGAPASTASSASRSIPSPRSGPGSSPRTRFPTRRRCSVTVDVNGERRQDYSTSDMERPVPRAADLHLLGDDAAPRRRHLLRHEPPGARLDAGRRRGRDHGLGHRVVHGPRAATSTSGHGSAGSTARRASA